MVLKHILTHYYSFDDPITNLAHIMTIFLNTERWQVIDAKWFT